MNNNKLLAFISLVLSLSIIFAGTNVYAETTFEKIKRTGKVTVGTEAAFPPFEFVEDGKIVGYGKLWKDIKQLIFELEIENVQLIGMKKNVFQYLYFQKLCNNFSF